MKLLNKGKGSFKKVLTQKTNDIIGVVARNSDNKNKPVFETSSNTTFCYYDI